MARSAQTFILCYNNLAINQHSHLEYMGIFDKLKDINEMRKQAKVIEAQLAQVQVTGKSSGEKIKLTMDGNQNVLSVEVDPGIVGDKAEIARNIRAALE